MAKFCNQYGIGLLESNLSLVLQESFPKLWSTDSRPYFDWKVKSKAHPSVKNMEKVWKHLNTLQSIDNFRNLPLLPSKQFKDIGNDDVFLIKLNKLNPVLDCSGQDDSLVKFLEDISDLSILRYNPVIDISHLLRSYTNKLTPEILVKCLAENKLKVVKHLQINREAIVNFLYEDKNSLLLQRNHKDLL